MVTLTKLGVGALETPQGGKGMRLSVFRVSFGPNSEGISASDLELRSIHHIEYPAYAFSRGTALIGSVASPGSPNNYASFDIINFGTGALATAVTTGTVTTTVIAWGE